MSREEANLIARAAERMRRGSRSSLKVVVPTAAALGAGAAVAIGQIPGSGGTITACYYNVPANQGGDYPYGTLRVIDPSQTNASDPLVYSCQQGLEQTITWNQQGPTGPQGQTGQQGQTGPQGQGATPVPESTMTLTGNSKAGIYVKLDGVPGQDAKGGPSGTFPVNKFILGAAGVVSGKTMVTIQTFEIDAPAGNAADFTLQHDFVSGQTIKQGEVIVQSKAGPNAKGPAFSTYEFKNIKVVDFQGAGKGQPTDAITLSYGEIKTILGSGQQKLTTGWSTAKSLGGFDIATQKTP